MARGKPIPGLEEAIIITIGNNPGRKASDIWQACQHQLPLKLSQTTVSSALTRLTKKGVLRKESPKGKKVPFKYFLEEEGEKNG